MKPFFITLIFAIACGPTPKAETENHDLQSRLEKALQDARSISNVEIHFVQTEWFKGAKGNPAPLDKDFTITNQVSYIASGVKYRKESRTTFSNSKKVLVKERAFDGKLYSEFDPETGYLVQQDGDIPGDIDGDGLNPLAAPFLFLSRQSDQNFPCGLRFTDLSSADALNGLVLPDGRSSNGMLHVSFTGLTLGGANGTWKITVDQSGPGFMPKTISEFTPYAFSGVSYPGETTYTLSDYTRLGAYHFPRKIAYIGTTSSAGAAPTVQGTGTITIVSIKRPSHIAKSTFSFNKSARFIWNDSRDSKAYNVGVILSQEGSSIVVKRIIPGSPAAKQNDLKVGDKLLKIADDRGEETVHGGANGVFCANELFRGAKGTTVSLTFVPAGRADAFARVISLARTDVKERLSSQQFPDEKRVGAKPRNT